MKLLASPEETCVSAQREKRIWIPLALGQQGAEAQLGGWGFWNHMTEFW